MKILGLSCFYHDSAACLIIDGEIRAAAHEERFTRVKHDQKFPHQAIKYCLAEEMIDINDLDLIVFYDKPFLKFERLLETYLAYAPRGLRSYLKAMEAWIKQKLWIGSIIEKETGFKGKIIYSEHHLSHAASAFFPSPFERAAFLTVDGVGEWATTSYGVGNDKNLEIRKEINFPHSLGLLYSAFTYYTGFKVNSGEYKLMGLAPYGEPKYKELIYEKLLDIKEDGSFRLNMEYFDYPAGLVMTNAKFAALFGGPARKPESEITQKEMDLAKSIQEVTEEIMLKLVRHIRKETGEKYLCLAGGVALNCVANRRIIEEGGFEDVWIQPASGDAGGALGAALVGHYLYAQGERPALGSDFDRQRGSYLGPSFGDKEIKVFLDRVGAKYEYVADEVRLMQETAATIAKEKVVGWFQGRMEYGPRALGARSIIGDARSPKMQKEMNLKIKFREGFRPFAPSVLLEKAGEHFENGRPSPYMLVTSMLKPEKRLPLDPSKTGLDKLEQIRSHVPAITHVDYSARLQTVAANGYNQRYYALIKEFDRQTGCPIIINTSFNVRGEPIVCTPEDAYLCFRRTNMDVLVLGNFFLKKEEQPELGADEDWRGRYELD